MPAPQAIKLHQQSQTLELRFEDATFVLEAELLRVYSPSAEVRGHGGSGGERPAGKQFVRMEKVVPQGHYAIRIEFDDGHGSGLYTWEYLADLGRNRERHWADYETELANNGRFRDPDQSAVRLSL